MSRTIRIEITEEEIIRKTNEMCVESLSPEHFEKWEGVLTALCATRSALPAARIIMNAAIAGVIASAHEEAQG